MYFAQIKLKVKVRAYGSENIGNPVTVDHRFEELT
jgi:hypothetical protein